MIIKGRNFQSWEAFDLTIKGLTAIIGPTDTGKSSFFRAFKALARNDLDAGQIRLGSNESSVGLIEGPTEVYISRTSRSSNKYDINGEEFKKTGGAIPKELNDLGLGLVEVGDFKFDPIFANQFADQFGITWTPMQINQVLGAFASTEKLELGKKEVNRRITETHTESKVVAEDLSDLEKLLPRASKLAEESDMLEEHIGELEMQISFKERNLGDLDRLLKTSERLVWINNHISLFDLSSESLKALQGKIISLKRLLDISYRLKGIRKVSGSIQDLEISALREKNNVLNSLKEFEDLSSRIRNVDFSIPDSSDVKSLFRKICLLSGVVSTSRDLRGSETSLGSLNKLNEELTEELVSLSSNAVACPKCGYVLEKS